MHPAGNSEIITSGLLMLALVRIPRPQLALYSVEGVVCNITLGVPMSLPG